MFLKIIKSSNGVSYVYIVEAYREHGKIKHRQIASLGRIDDILGNESIARLGKRLIELTSYPSILAIDIENEEKEVSPGRIKNYGYIVYKKLWERYNLSKYLTHIAKEKRNQKNKNNKTIEFNLQDTVFTIVINHLLSPQSKLGMYNTQDRYLDLPHTELHHIYRALDILSEHKEDIEKMLYKKNLNLLNMNVDVVFYDVTTFHFESVRSDTLREFGFSKNGKFNEVQVVLGLLINREGIPIGYDIFPGNTFDGNTLEHFLDRLSTRFDIKKVIIVADRGINSKLNLKRIRDKGYDYIVAKRLKNAGKEIIEHMLSDEGYVVLRDEIDETFKNEISKDEISKDETFKDQDSKNENSKNENSQNENSKNESLFKYKQIPHRVVVRDENGGRHTLEDTLIITYSDKRRKKDEKDRERLIEKAIKLLDNPSKIDSLFKKGAKRFLREVKDPKDKNTKAQKDKADKETRENTKTYILDSEKIAHDKLFDGYYAIQTSKKDLHPLDVIGMYHMLWKIEESFRIMKTTLEVRPIFHWTEKRIKGHFVVAFLSFLLLRALEYKLKNRLDKEDRPSLSNSSFSITGESIREALNTLTVTEVKIKGREYYIKNKPSKFANKILRIMGIRPIKNIQPKEKLKV